MTTPAHPYFRTLKAQWIVLATICVLLFQAFAGGVWLPSGLGLDDATRTICTGMGVAGDDAGRDFGGENSGGDFGLSHHDCAVFCQTIGAAAPLLLRYMAGVPEPSERGLVLGVFPTADIPAPAHPPRRLVARGPPLSL